MTQEAFDASLPHQNGMPTDTSALVILWGQGVPAANRLPGKRIYRPLP